MNWFQSFLIFLLIFLIEINPKAQVVIQPTIGSKTHASMSVDSIVMDDNQTLCFIKIVNENSEGTAWFCADEDIVLVENEGQIKHKMLESRGIPTCPEAHEFTALGEVLCFELLFPPVKNRLGDIDIVEQCAEHCFSLNDIVLDPLLNQEIRLFEEAVLLFQKDRFEEALHLFKNLVNSPYKTEKHFAYSTYIIPILYWKLRDEKMARQSYRVLRDSSILEKEYFLNKIREIPFFRSMD